MGMVYNQIYSAYDRVVQVIEKADPIKNMLSSLTAGLRFIINSPHELPKIVDFCHYVTLLKDAAPYVQEVVDKIIPVAKNLVPTTTAVFNTMNVTKDYLTFLEFWTNVRDIQSSKANTPSKLGEYSCKLGYSTIETFLLLPNKFKWIDLASWIGEASTSLLQVGSWSLVIGSSSFSIYNCNKSIAKAQADLTKDTIKLGNLRQIANSPTPAVMRKYLGDLNVAETKKSEKLLQTYMTIARLSQQINIWNHEIDVLKNNPMPNVSQINAFSAELESKKKALDLAEQKAKRSVYFYFAATGTDLSVEARRIIKNIYIQDRLISLSESLKYNGITEPVKQDLIQQITTADPKARTSNFEQRVCNAIPAKATVDTPQDPLLNLIDESANLDNRLRQLTNKPKITEVEIKEIVDFKSKKYIRDIDLKDSLNTKSYYKRAYEVAKIAVVACLILLNPMTQAMLPAIFVGATAAAALNFALWISGFAICITGLRRNIFEAFYYKDEDKVARPTTQLA